MYVKVKIKCEKQLLVSGYGLDRIKGEEIRADRKFLKRLLEKFCLNKKIVVLKDLDEIL